MLFDPSRHEPLCDTPWDEAAARAAIRRIVDEICAQFDPHELWPSHPREREREDGDAPVPQPMLYNGAAGVIWALQRLRDQGAAPVEIDLTPIVAGLHEHSQRWIAANESEQASYFLGHSGVLLLQWMWQRSPATADALFALVEGNLHNKALESLWGSPGTLVAALHMLEATHEPRWHALFRHGVDALWQQMRPVRHSAHPDREVWVWTQDLYGKTRTYLGAGHGFAGNLFPVIRGARWLDPSVVEGFEARALATLDVAATREAGQLHWEPVFDPVAEGAPLRPMLQDCHGAPGTICRLAATRCAPLQAMLRQAGELVWAAGPLTKRPGLCHGTDGNGYAFLKLYTATGDPRWLARARSFATHAMLQSDALAAQYGRRVPSLWTGDLGLALYLWGCINADDALPTLDVF